jgi:hypothetical protein
VVGIVAHDISCPFRRITCQPKLHAQARMCTGTRDELQVLFVGILVGLYHEYLVPMGAPKSTVQLTQAFSMMWVGVVQQVVRGAANLQGWVCAVLTDHCTSCSLCNACLLSMLICTISLPCSTFCLSLLLVFRTNSSYARWYERTPGGVACAVRQMP